MVARAGGEHAAALLPAQAGNEVEAAAHLEGIGRIVVLVLDEQVEAGRLIEQRVLEERRGAQRAVEDPARGIDVAK